MKWMSMMKYAPQGAANVRDDGATHRRDRVAEALGANGVTLLHWWHGASADWDVIMVVETDQSAAVQAKYIIETFATGDMARAISIPLADPEDLDAIDVVPHPSAG